MLRVTRCVLVTGCGAHAVAPAVTIPLPLPPPPTAEVVAPVELPPPPVPADYVRVSVAGVVRSQAVVLTDPSEQVALPIYIGGTEAASIRSRYDHTPASRPLTHDLFDSALHALGARVVRVQIDKLEDDTYFATLVLKHHGRYIQLDARPSDGVALALGANAPIFCASRVLAAAGVPRDSFEGLRPRTP